MDTLSYDTIKAFYYSTIVELTNKYKGVVANRKTLKNISDILLQKSVHFRTIETGHLYNVDVYKHEINPYYEINVCFERIGIRFYVEVDDINVIKEISESVFIINEGEDDEYFFPKFTIQECLRNITKDSEGNFTSFNTFEEDNVSKPTNDDLTHKFEGYRVIGKKGNDSLIIMDTVSHLCYIINRPKN